MDTKGKVAEREVARLIETWWRQYEPMSKFVRTPLSGGWGTADTRAGFGAAGDLMTTAMHFPFTVEVKRREGWTTKRLLDGWPSPVWQWWIQAQGQASEMGKVPMLWLRRNREADWRVILPQVQAVAWDLPIRQWGSDAHRRINWGTWPALILARELMKFHPKRFVGGAACRESGPATE